MNKDEMLRTCSTYKTPLYKTLVVKPSTRGSLGSYKHRIRYNNKIDVKERVNYLPADKCHITESICCHLSPR